MQEQVLLLRGVRGVSTSSNSMFSFWRSNLNTPPAPLKRAIWFGNPQPG